MSFRRAVFLSLVLAVLAATLVEAGFDVALDRLLVTDGANIGAAANPPKGTLAAGSEPANRPDRLLLDLIDIPVVLAIAVTIAWGLSAWLGRPLRRLTNATIQLSSQRVPEPVPVPSGNDELAELARSFNIMAGAIRDHVEREQAFTRYASHELRTPLSAMRLQIERAEANLTTAAEILPAMSRQVRRMDEILSALLSITRSQASEGPRPVAVLVREALAHLPPDAHQRVRVRSTAPAHLEVHSPRLAQQALANLLDNALRHGRGPTTVEVDAEASSLTLRVQDSGTGVPSDALSQLAEPFFRRTDDDSGTGLGLTFVSLVARTLGGSLTLDNAAPGMLAVLSLPIVVTHES